MPDLVEEGDADFFVNPIIGFRSGPIAGDGPFETTVFFSGKGKGDDAFTEEIDVLGLPAGSEIAGVFDGAMGEREARMQAAEIGAVFAFLEESIGDELLEEGRIGEIGDDDGNLIEEVADGFGEIVDGFFDEHIEALLKFFGHSASSLSAEGDVRGACDGSVSRRVKTPLLGV